MSRRTVVRAAISAPASAMAKLSARDRAQLMVIAYQAGLVRPGRGRTELGVLAALPAPQRPATMAR
jgi:hypothetical protein